MHASTILPNLVGCTVDEGTLLLKKVVGAGGFGKLYHAVDTESACSSRRSSWASTNTTSSSSSSTPSSVSMPGVYAVKCLHNSPFYDRERILHRRVSSHPNIVTVHQDFTSEEHLFIVMDFHASGDMSFAIADGLYHRNTPLVKRTFAQIAEAILFCHDQGVFHRDIKPDNILVDHDGGNPCLTDFGLATRKTIISSKEAGSHAYMCPESFEEGFLGPYSTSSCDSWALGITLLNMVTTQGPWHSARPLTDSRFKSFCADGETYLLAHHPISRSLAALLSRFLCVDSNERISMELFKSEVEEMEELYMSPVDLRRASVVLKDLAAWVVPGRPAVTDPTVPRLESGAEEEEKGEGGEGNADESSDELPSASPAVAKAGKFKRVVRRLRFWRK
ncbi:kinase-like domain-containing protein [Roridomyces roridus]|uniref:non-specific serine/threonine protein kinase n=1 Tax=Roridomyces roridus TaxID=1738132 RepID=A0AAD7BBK2_9AGAR|nr:kinase-like domain-containing protein [Roridomyces roridus]